MAFGLFKKKNYADVVIRGGKIYTLDPEYPEAEALAVKEGRVLLAGDNDEIEKFIGPDTQIVELDGKYAVPGFIDRFGRPARQTLKGTYLSLDTEMNEEDVIAAVSAYFAARPEAEFCLAVDMNEKLGEEPEEDSEEGVPSFRKLLSGAFPDKPVVLVSSNALTMIINDAAMEIVQARAEEMNVLTVTPAYVIDSVVSTDYDFCVKQLCANEESYAKQGITSVYASEQYSFFENMYRDLLMESVQADLIKQRYFGSFQVRRRLVPQSVVYTAERKHTVCQELDGKINFDTIEIRFSGDPDSPDYMGEEYLREMAEAVADKGYNIRFIAIDKAAALNALDTAGNLSSTYHRQSFAVVHKEDFTDEELGSVFTGDSIELAIGGPRLKHELTGEALIRDLTETASRDIGAWAIGTLEEGKWADLAVFREDPFADDFTYHQAAMTIIAGRPVYTEGEDSASLWVKQMGEAIGVNIADLFGEEEA